MKRLVLPAVCAIAGLAFLSCQQPQTNAPVANENKPAASPEAPKQMAAAYDAETMSNRLVTQVAGVKEADVGFINGGGRGLGLFENFGTDGPKTGGIPLLNNRRQSP